MTSQRDIERLLDQWLADGPDEVPERVFDEAVARIRRSPQRAAWRPGWRADQMLQWLKWGGTIAAILVLAVIGGRLLIGAPSGVGSVTPAPVATASPTASPSFLALVMGASSLPPGPYRAGTVAGRVTFELPAGWSNPQSGALDFTLHWNGGAADDQVKVFFDMRRAAQDAACTEAPEPGVGVTAEELAQDIAADPDLTVTTPSRFIGDHLSGYVVDIALAPGVDRTCPFAPGEPNVPVIVDDVDGEGPFWGIGAGGRLRLVILDAPAGHTIVVAIDSPDGRSFDALVDATMPIVESLTFAPA